MRGELEEKIDGTPFLYKHIREDEYDFWELFVQELLQGVKFPRRHGPRKDWTIRLAAGSAIGTDDKYEIVPSKNRPSRGPKQGFSKVQSLTYADPQQEYFAPEAILSGGQLKVRIGIRIRPEKAIIYRIIWRDTGTFLRPYDHFSKEDAERWLNKQITDGVWHTNLNSLVAKGKQHPRETNEVMARISLLSTDAILIFTDNIPARLLAQIRQRDFKRATNIELPILFYPSLKPYRSPQDDWCNETCPSHCVHKSYSPFLVAERNDFFNLTIKQWCNFSPILIHLTEATKKVAYSAVGDAEIESYYLTIKSPADYFNFIKALPLEKKLDFLKRKQYNPLASEQCIQDENASLGSLFFIELLQSLRKEDLLVEDDVKFFLNEKFREFVPIIIKNKPSLNARHIPVWSFILQHYPEYIDYPDKQRNTFLIAAIYYAEDVDQVKKAVSMGANLNAKKSLTIDGSNKEFTAIELARRYSNRCRHIVTYLGQEEVELPKQCSSFVEAARRYYAEYQRGASVASWISARQQFSLQFPLDPYKLRIGSRLNLETLEFNLLYFFNEYIDPIYVLKRAILSVTKENLEAALTLFPNLTIKQVASALEMMGAGLDDNIKIFLLDTIGRRSIAFFIFCLERMFTQRIVNPYEIWAQQMSNSDFEMLTNSLVDWHDKKKLQTQDLKFYFYSPAFKEIFKRYVDSPDLQIAIWHLKIINPYELWSCNEMSYSTFVKITSKLIELYKAGTLKKEDLDFYFASPEFLAICREMFKKNWENENKEIWIFLYKEFNDIFRRNAITSVFSFKRQETELKSQALQVIPKFDGINTNSALAGAENIRRCLALEKFYAQRKSFHPERAKQLATILVQMVNAVNAPDSNAEVARLVLKQNQGQLAHRYSKNYRRAMDVLIFISMIGFIFRTAYVVYHRLPASSFFLSNQEKTNTHIACEEFACKIATAA